jgi:hypothetical protein
MLRVGVWKEEVSAVKADWISQNHSQMAGWLGKQTLSTIFEAIHIENRCSLIRLLVNPRI